MKTTIEFNFNEFEKFVNKEINKENILSELQFFLLNQSININPNNDREFIMNCSKEQADMWWVTVKNITVTVSPIPKHLGAEDIQFPNEDNSSKYIFGTYILPQGVNFTIKIIE